MMIKQNVSYKGNVFTGVKFKDHSNQTVSCDVVKSFKNPMEKPVRYESDVCGTEAQDASDWISLGGPVKG